MRAAASLRLAAVTMVLGVIVSFVAFGLGARVDDPHDLAGVLQAFSTAPERLYLHGIGIAAGALLLLIGVAALSVALHEDAGGPLAFVALAVAAVKSAMHLLGGTVGGAALPALAVAHAAATPDDAAGLLPAAGAMYVFYESLLAPTFFAIAAMTILYGAALTRSRRFPAWLGWVGVVVAAAGAVLGLAIAPGGPMAVAERIGLFVGPFMVMMAWFAVVGVVAWGVRAKAG